MSLHPTYDAAPLTTRSSPTNALAITDEASPFALRSTRNRLRTAVRQGTGWTRRSATAAVWSGGGQARPLAVFLSAELSWLLIAPCGAYPAELLGGVPVVGRRCGQVGRDVRRTVRCRSLSTIGCPPGPVSSRPVSSRRVSDRRVSGRLVPSSRTGLSGRLVPPVRRPAVWCPPVRPVASVPSRVSPPWPLGPRRSSGAFTA